MVSEKSKVYQAVAYYRLSKDDGDKGESNSIINQRKLIHEFVSASGDITLAGEKQDDGYTGTNFDRPGFKELLRMLEEGKADCVIVKDLSRLGRDYIETGKYIERIFPAMGIRFIAVNDCIDSGKKNQADEIVIPFKNLINDSYCRELSNKLRRQFRVQRAKGEFIGSFAAFGYLKSPADRHRLVVDETAADVVRLIFARRIAGYSCQKIADYLNQFGFLSPSEYKKSIGLNYRSGFKERTQSAWGAATIRRILTNRIYVGDLEQGKRSTPNYKVKKMQEKERGEWVIVQGAHEAIVSHEVFETVARLAERDARTSPKQDKVYPLSGILFCGDCGSQMRYSRCYHDGKVHGSYYCGAYDYGRCAGRHTISQEKLKKIVWQSMQDQMLLYCEYRKIPELLQNKGGSSQLEDCRKELQRLSVQINSRRAKRERLYEDFTDGILSPEEYMAVKKKYDDEYQELSEKANEVQARMIRLKKSFSSGNLWLKSMGMLEGKTEVTMELVTALIDRLTIYQDGDGSLRLEIQYKYGEDAALLESACKELEGGTA